jgi:opacity protein-like surface antigen
MNSKKYLVLSLLCLGLSGMAQANDLEQQVRTLPTERKLRLMLAPGADSIDTAGGNLSGIGMGIGIQYGFSDRWALGGNIKQSFSISSSSAIFTELDAQLTYAVTGSMTRHRHTVTLDGREVFDAEDYGRGGLRLGILAEQYFFTSSVLVIPYSGLGAQMVYEFPSHSTVNWFLGARIDMITNGVQILNPESLFGGAAIWF